MEIRQLTYFVKAAELLHFTAAAEAVYITQSTLSQQIKQLEDELGMPLFDRIGKQVRLTSAGQVFLEHARTILHSVTKARQAIDDMNNLIQGELRIGVTYAFTSIIIPVLTEFSRDYPDLKISIDYDAPENLQRKLKQSELDFMLSFHNWADDKELSLEPLLRSNIVMVVNKDHELAGRKSISIKDLQKLQLILPAKGFSSRDFIDEIFSQQRIDLKIRIELNDVHSLLSLVKEGRQITIINSKALIGWQDLVQIPIENKSLDRQSYIIWLRGAYRSKAASLFANKILEKNTG